MLQNKLLSSLSPDLVFLVDGLGALLTAGSIYLLARFFINWVGLPYEVLHILAMVALGMAAYSLSCHFFLKGNKRNWLNVIILANLLYVLATAVLILIYYDRIKLPGLIYFLSEFAVVLVLVRWERKIAISK
ncbi:MAG: hypothetical protein WBP58_11345 [Chitinophagaceae bacterium]